MNKNEFNQGEPRKVYYDFCNYFIGYIGRVDTKKLFYAEAYLVYLAKKNKINLKISSYDDYGKYLGKETMSPKTILKLLLEIYEKNTKITKQYLILKEIERLFKKNLTTKEIGNNTIDKIVKLNDQELIEIFVVNSLELSEYQNKEYYSSDKGIIEFVSYVLNIKDDDTILDLCSGNGDFLVNQTKEVNNKISKNLKLNGIDINEDAAFISIIRLAVLAEEKAEIIIDDALTHNFGQKFDKIFCEYPLGLRVDNYKMNQLSSEMLYNWHKSGLTSDWMFLNKVVSLLKPNGTAVMIIGEGPLFKSMDKDCRRDILASGIIKAIIKLPSGILSYTNVSANMIVLSRDNNDNEITFIDASHEFIEDRNRERELDIKAVINLINGNDNNPEKIKKVYVGEICNTDDLLLTVNSYVGRKEPSYFNPHILKEFLKDKFRGYIFLSKEQNEIEDINGKYELLTLSDINDGSINNRLLRISDNNNKYDRYLLKDGDVIITSKGSRIKTAVAEVGNRKIIPNGNLLVLRIDMKKLNPYYLQAFLNSKNGLLALEQIQTGAKIKSINPSRIEQMKISMIDKDFQDVFAERYKRKLTELNIAQEEVKNIRNQIENLFFNEIEEKNNNG